MRPDAVPPTGANAVEVYWRPGCQAAGRAFDPELPILRARHMTAGHFGAAWRAGVVAAVLAVRSSSRPRGRWSWARPDALTRVQAGPRRVSDVPPASIEVATDLALPPAELVFVGGTCDPQIRIPGLGAVARVGAFLTVTMTFRDAAPLTVDVQFADAANYLAPLAPEPTFAGRAAP